jgi:hypothetical protein
MALTQILLQEIKTVYYTAAILEHLLRRNHTKFLPPTNKVSTPKCNTFISMAC